MKQTKAKDISSVEKQRLEQVMTFLLLHLYYKRTTMVMSRRQKFTQVFISWSLSFLITMGRGILLLVKIQDHPMWALALLMSVLKEILSTLSVNWTWRHLTTTQTNLKETYWTKSFSTPKSMRGKNLMQWLVKRSRTTKIRVKRKRITMPLSVLSAKNAKSSS